MLTLSRFSATVALGACSPDADVGAYDEAEEETGVAETPPYDDQEPAVDGVWDTSDDGVVGRDEVADTFWDWFDMNDDNLVDSTEFEQATA